MFNKSEKKYLDLTVRVSYDERNDTVSITSKDKRLPKGSGGFHLSLNGGRGAEQTLRTMLEDAGIIAEEHIIPSKLSYDEISESTWDQFPLGKMGGSRTAFWTPTSSPNLLLSGPAGAGKSIVERSLIFHCLQHPNKWRILGIDLKRIELLPYSKYSPVVVGIATELEDAVEICRYARDEMMDRYTRMEELGINNYQDLPDAPHAIMFLVDEASVVLSISGVKTDEGKAEDKMKGEISTLLTKIARLGRAAGIHLVLSTQRPDASIFSQELRNRMTTRIVMGRVDAIHSRIALGNEEASRIPWNIRGRGYIQDHRQGQGQQFQSAFAPLEWFDELLSKNPHLPTESLYEDIAESTWDVFPLGKARGSMIATWDTNNSANLLINGSVGSGKSTIERNLIFHCLQHPDKWRVWGIDLGPWELASLSKKYAPVVENVATDMDGALEICRAVRDEMLDRHEKMAALGVKNYRDLPDEPTAIMFLISELSGLFGSYGGQMPIGITKDALQDEFSMILTKISRLGRAAGIHLVLSSWETGTNFIGNELRDNLTTKIHLGSTAPAESPLLLGDTDAALLNWMKWEGRTIRGRGYIKHLGRKGQEFQAASSDMGWYDKWVAKNPHHKGLYPKTN